MHKLFVAVFGAAGLAMILAGCASESGSPDPAGNQAPQGNVEVKTSEASPEGVVRPNTTLSFFNTCNNPQVDFNDDNSVSHAQADSCLRRDGSWGGFTAFWGHCTGDISNSNGNIVCTN